MAQLTEFVGGESFEGCGIKSRNGKRRNTRDAMDFILNGNNSPVMEHPWHAAIVNDDLSIFCGGNLISKIAIVTGEKMLQNNCRFRAPGHFILRDNSYSCEVTGFLSHVMYICIQPYSCSLRLELQRYKQS
jgi:hypothetical protein